MFENLFSYGFHDTKITNFEIVDNYIKISFGDGIYNLDEKGREKDLTKPISMFIKINNEYPLNIFDSINVLKSNDRKVCASNIATTNAKNELIGAEIINLYYSDFNSVLLFEAGTERGWFFVEISNCLEISFKCI